MNKKSEIIMIRFFAKKGECFRIPVELPWDIFEKAQGFMGHNLICDITGVLENIDEFRSRLIELKNNHDALNSELLISFKE